VVPPLAVVETGKTLKFNCAGIETLGWFVNDVERGDSTVGTISVDGLYSAPSIAPTPRSVTIRARLSENRSAGATIDLVQRESLLSRLAVVTAVAYLENLNRFFVAEQLLLSASPSAAREESSATSQILEVSAETGAGTVFQPLPGDTVGKMIPFVDGARVTYLLIAGTTTGSIYRLRISDKKLDRVVTGLTTPTSLALDPVTGNMFVAEQDAGLLTVILRSRFDPTSSEAFDAAADGPARVDINLPAVSGVAFDSCSGALLATTSRGEIHEFRGDTRRTLISGLQRPDEMLVMYRDGLSCAGAANVLVGESTGVSRVLLPAGEKQSFLTTTLPVRDLVFLPKDSPFAESGQQSVVFAEAGTAESLISSVVVSGIYRSATPQNTEIPSGGTSSGGVPYRDPAGDTFGGKTIDLVSVNASFKSGKLHVSLNFAEPVAPASANAPNSLRGFVDFDVFPNHGSASHAQNVNPLNPIDMGVDYYVNLSTGILHDLVEGETLPMQVSFLGNTATYTYYTDEPPEIQNAAMVVIVGDRQGMTDVAPNTGLIKFKP
jgi:hypothetical protein